MGLNDRALSSSNFRPSIKDSRPTEWHKYYFLKTPQYLPVTATCCPSWYQLILAPCAARTFTVSSISLWRLTNWFSGGTMISGGWWRWWRWVATLACSSTDSCLDTRLALTSSTWVFPLAVFCSTIASLQTIEVMKEFSLLENKLRF